MSIEKMSLMNIYGDINDLDQVLIRCCESKLFHAETAPTGSSGNTVFRTVNDPNPHIGAMQNITQLLNDLSIPEVYQDYSDLDMTDAQIEDYITQVQGKIREFLQKRNQIKTDLDMHNQAAVTVSHMFGLNCRIDDIFQLKYSKACFGRLPVDSYPKLAYFSKKNFFFFPFDHDEYYYWGMYFVPISDADEIENLFESLYFEEVKIPDYAHGNPQSAAEALHKQIQEEKNEIAKIDQQLEEVKKQEFIQLQQVYSLIKVKHDSFQFRKYAVIFDKQFRLEGFVPKRKVKKFAALFDDLPNVICEDCPEDTDARLTPPVKLRTNWLFRPFEMYVEMYGLPGYYDFNPTSYIGLIYTLLFGMMFGDFGQGICVILVGIFMWKWRKMMLGQILTRCGVASMFFGMLYGSCFGFEGCFKPLFNAIGLGNIFPLDVMDSNTSISILIVSLGIGVVIILASMIINIYLGFKKKDMKKALFSNNGLAGLLFYGGIIGAVILMLVLKVNVFNPFFLAIVVILPLVLIFFQQPLGQKLNRRLFRKRKKEEEEKFSGVDASFEMFDILLSYCTNTLSFLRVGGFVLSHAALMLVVMTFAHMAGSFGSPIVVVIGNIFVMGLEGLIVGIQVLRLVYYETFSRFYESDGKPFKPLTIDFKYAKKGRKK